MNSIAFGVQVHPALGAPCSATRMCARSTSVGTDSASLSVARWTRFRDCWAGEWSGHWDRVDALSNVTSQTDHKRIFVVNDDRSEVNQRNVVESPTWHRGGGLERLYKHTQASFDSYPLLTLVRPGGDALQVSRGRLGALEKTFSHPVEPNKRAAVVLLFAAGAIGLCTFLTETRANSSLETRVSDKLEAIPCIDSNGDVCAVPQPYEMPAENTLTLTLGGGEFFVQIPRDLNKSYGKPFNISFKWVAPNSQKIKNVVVHFNEEQRFFCEHSLLL